MGVVVEAEVGVGQEVEAESAAELAAQAGARDLGGDLPVRAFTTFFVTCVGPSMTFSTFTSLTDCAFLELAAEDSRTPHLTQAG